MPHTPKFPLLLLACCATWPAAAQPSEPAPAEERIRVVPVENVKLDHAQVLRVEPVYQTLRATRVEERCDATPVIEVHAPPEDEASPGVLSRVVDSVKGLFAREPSPSDAAAATAAPSPRGHDCRLVQVDRQFQRPIAYDVDYVYKGTKYRSRLAEDPGNRLRVRVSVTPWVDDASASAP